ncbi:hypothetical protein ALC62_11211 [Cyphomyrmex costatus]|uniref:RING-type domain-containing protein n=2 Tax=Cyphomyrmex costatus TaxID=456900 RepID=A0A195CAY3_9HYME|nr:hypothetical protein ALC62_11211 [Cyphomyrmex costatus]
MEMNMLICNKCYAPFYRGKHPYHITQCGHISCQSCLQQFEKQCPQCQRIGTISLALEEPLIPKVMPFFQPFADTMEMMLKVDAFHNNQIKIIMQRYQELDKKYEVLKTRYWMSDRNLKALMEKYVTLKNNKAKLEKQLALQMANRETPRSFVMETPADSGIFSNGSNQSSTGYSLASSSNLMKSVGLTPIGSPEKKFYRTIDGFRIPAVNRKPVKSLASLNNTQFL